jgi:hypothetical protein
LRIEVCFWHAAKDYSEKKDLCSHLKGFLHAASVMLGRRDSGTANRTAANTNIPAPTANLANLTSKFGAQGLSKREMVVLSGNPECLLTALNSFYTQILGF